MYLVVCSLYLFFFLRRSLVARTAAARLEMVSPLKRHSFMVFLGLSAYHLGGRPVGPGRGMSKVSSAVAVMLWDSTLADLDLQ